MIASFIRRIVDISSSVSGRFRGAEKWFRHGSGHPAPDVVRVDTKNAQESGGTAGSSRPWPGSALGKIP
jgi:hypothetical protein